jgi:hypothetical protein
MDGHPWRRSISALALLLGAPLCVSLVIGAGVSADRDGEGGKASTEQLTFLYDASARSRR